MSPRGSSERLAFLRREIARIESTGATGLPRSAPTSRDYGPAPAFLSAARLAGGLHEIVPASAPDSHAALMLGLLLAAAKTEDPQRWAHWKEAGDALLAEKGDAVQA